jgi:hypothetical protein
MLKPRKMRWTGNVTLIGKMRSAHKISIGKPERKRPLGRPICKWADNIKNASYNSVNRVGRCGLDLSSSG